MKGMRTSLSALILMLVGLLASPRALGAESGDWMRELGAIAIQDGGRVMPLEGYARRLAVDVTGRQRWSRSRGPEGYAGREPLELLCDAMFQQQKMLHTPLIQVANKPFKAEVGLDASREFFSAVEIGSSEGVNRILREYQEARSRDPQASATKHQRIALDLFDGANRLAALCAGEPLPIIPAGSGQTFRSVGLTGSAEGLEPVRDALREFGRVYTEGGDRLQAARRLREAVAAAGTLDAAQSRGVALEQFYDRHDPWRKTQLLYGAAIIAFGFSRLVWRRWLVAAALLLTGLGLAEHLLGLSLRVAILGRAPVSNTFEALLWMGIVAILVGLIAQLLSRKSYYLFGGVCAALVSVLFAGLVPLTDRSNSLPAVLRSNYWLIVHVLTIVASYGVLLVAAVLGHVYLVREVLLGKPAAGGEGQRLSHPIIAQSYRTIQVGLLLLTAGTILGGVWAADSWGRFWGWDPKETWALISIVVYFAVLHARYVGWLRDFGLAASAVLGFVVIVWTFYGVNYVMATGLHSYGFGSGGELWVGLWAVAEIVFLLVCRWRYAALHRSGPSGVTPAAA
ncbi:MAG: hypothetical protein DYG92_00365 [Leptolyngbya sp. PLA1]|nr:hypothetical protein [Leptolyngbya sp. PLA1]